MEIKIRIRTPKGSARKAEKTIRPFIIGRRKHDLYISPEENELVWVVNDTPRKCIQIQKNLGLFDQIIKNIFGNKQMQRIVGQQVSKEQQAELKEMLANHTEIEILKEATLQEMQEDKMTLWERIKSKFRKETRQD